MLAPFAALAVPGGQDIRNVKAPYLHQLFPVRTNQNGYQDYVAAADLVAHAPWADRQADKSLGPPALLARKRDRAAKAQKAIVFVVQGNRKRVWDPRKSLTFETLLPEFSSFKTLGHLMVDQADVDFADGHTSKGTQMFGQTLTFGRKVSNGDLLIADLVGTSIQAMAFQGLSDNWDRLDAAEARHLESLVSPGIDTARSSLEHSIVLDFDHDDRVAHELLNARIPDELRGDPNFKSFDYTLSVIGQLSAANVNVDLVALARRIETMSPVERRAHLANASRYRAAFVTWLHSRLAGPEAKWESEPPGSSDEVVQPVYEILDPKLAQALKAAAELRTKYRLLALACRVIEFRGAHGRLPNTAQDLGVGAMLKDPLAGTSFVYKRIGAGFQVYSLGTKSTGIVKLGRNTK